MKHCCKEIDFFIEEGSVSIYYRDKFRSYSVGMKNGTTAEQTIYFCPWCGARLPKNLRDEWFDILRSQYKIEYPLEDKRKIPKEFRTDEWWKKRGL